MKSIFTFFGFILIALQSDGQINLVPNSSFEDTISCPTGGSAIDLAFGWSTFRSSPDYFNSCNTSFISVPSNFAGNQNAKDGEAYAGIICYYSFINNAREFIGIELLQPLTSGQKYFVSFFTSLGYNILTSRMGIATNNIGIKLSTVPFSIVDPAPIDNISNVYSNSLLSDSVHWTKVSGSFVSDSAYSYLMIGNFFTDSLTTISIIDSSAIYSYYYIDQITVSTDSIFVNSLSEAKKNIHVSIFPNPTQEFIEISGDRVESVYITNLLGEIVLQKIDINEWPVKVDLSDLRKGVYFLNSISKILSHSNKIIVY